MAGGINPVHGDLLAQHNQKKQMDKQVEVAMKQLTFQTRKDAVKLAIEATTDAPDYSPQERDGLIMTRAIMYENYMLNGPAAIKFTEKKQNDETIQEKEKSESPKF